MPLTTPLIGDYHDYSPAEMTPEQIGLRNAERNSRLVDYNNEMKSQGLSDIGKAILLGLGTGMAGRGIIGMSQFGTSHLKKRKTLGSHASISEMPVPRFAPEEKIAIFNTPRGPEPPIGTPAHSDWATFKEPKRGLTGFLAGDDATTPTGMPWYVPGLVLGGAGALYGGYSLADAALKSREKAETDDELDEAKVKYRKALLSQYTPEQVEKWSSADKISHTLDKLFDAISVKTSGFQKEAVTNFLGQAAGGYGLLAGLLALGTGVATYKYTKDRNPDERLKKVLQQRQRERWLRRPPEIFAVPTDIHVTRPKFPQDNVADNADNGLEYKAAAFVKELVR